MNNSLKAKVQDALDRIADDKDKKSTHVYLGDGDEVCVYLPKKGKYNVDMTVPEALAMISKGQIEDFQGPHAFAMHTNVRPQTVYLTEDGTRFYIIIEPGLVGTDWFN